MNDVEVHESESHEQVSAGDVVGYLKLLVLMGVGLPVVLYLAAATGLGALASVVGMIGLPIGVIVLNARGAPKWAVTVGALLTLAGMPLLGWAFYRAFAG